MKLTFKKLTFEYQETILHWLTEPHVQEFWDNSPEHRADILIFMNGRMEGSPYWNGIFDYWIGFANDEPYCLLMTSEIGGEETDLPDSWKAHLSQIGKTLSIDFMIGNTTHLGRGLGAPTLEAFTQFIQDKIDRSVDTFFIDPAATNPRAKHVYEKAGFHNAAIFYRDCGDKKNVKHFLLVKRV